MKKSRNRVPTYNRGGSPTKIVISPQVGEHDFPISHSSLSTHKFSHTVCGVKDSSTHHLSCYTSYYMPYVRYYKIKYLRTFVKNSSTSSIS